jgi:large subunit ribosomal protein L22
MEFKAKQKWIKLSPQKARLVADVVRGLDVQDAIDALKFMPQKAAPFVSKAVRSALANAREHKGEEKPDVDRLFLKSVVVDVGPTLKRIKPRAYGRAHRIRRRTSHIMVVLAERSEEERAAARARGESRRRVGRPGAPAEGPRKPAEGEAEERGAAPAKPKKPRFLGFKKKEDKYGAKVKGAGEAPEKPAAERRKAERGTKRGRKKK